MADTKKTENTEEEDTQPEKTYSVEEVAKRWECSQAFLKREIEIGLPMYRNQNGRLRIKESDLLDWEAKIEEHDAEKIKEQKRIKRNNRIAYIIGGILVAIFGIYALMTFSNTN